MAQDTTGICDILYECAAKIAFIEDAVAQDEITTFRFSEDGLLGFYLILRDIETIIRHAANEMPQAKEV